MTPERHLSSLQVRARILSRCFRVFAIGFRRSGRTGGQVTGRHRVGVSCSAFFQRGPNPLAREYGGAQVVYTYYVTMLTVNIYRAGPRCSGAARASRRGTESRPKEVKAMARRASPLKRRKQSHKGGRAKSAPRSRRGRREGPVG